LTAQLAKLVDLVRSRTDDANGLNGQAASGALDVENFGTYPARLMGVELRK
jgi:hypothetical protein